ncbi:glutamate racemase [Shewanella sp. 5_MG-2023]|uniref:glutamate racemase n=1 Tax=Shewanella sp. 5_MG-2023 TaxID=3062656 RepID=UPI0026E25328|nr:glutamate racemase [Shewanella sp. 5_MG-2023]MDO6640557.1 glutamate racemase [Shewanella sp. 5_MG-2023]
MSGPILIFDSGIGGLSVLEHIQTKMPAKDIFYLFDNARLPYGDLAEQALIEGCVALIIKQVACINASIVVVACNTASTLVLPHLRRRLTIPVVGVVPAIKPAAQLTQSKHIALLATPGTVERAYTKELIREFAGCCEVTLIGSSELVLIAEEKAKRKPINLNAIKPILASINGTDIDTLVLGCTHFPLLRQEIAECISHPVTLLDSGEAIAIRVVSLLETINRSAKGKTNKVGRLTAGFTKKIDKGLALTLADYGFKQLECISVGS